MRWMICALTLCLVAIPGTRVVAQDSSVDHTAARILEQSLIAECKTRALGIHGLDVGLYVGRAVNAIPEHRCLRLRGNLPGMR